MSRHANFEDNLIRNPRLISPKHEVVTITLSGAYIIPADGPEYLFFDPNGATRTVFLPEIPPQGGLTFMISNLGLVDNLNVVDHDGNSVHTIGVSQSILFFSSRTFWKTLLAPSEFSVLEVGHPSDTTITRVSPGVIAVEGVNVVLDSRAVATGAGLTGGGDLSSDRTISLANVADGRLLANISGGVAAPSAHTISDILDELLGSTRGLIAVRGLTEWGTLEIGAANTMLMSNGLDPIYRSFSLPLLSDSTFWLRTDGSDAVTPDPNATDAAANAFLTLQAALNYIFGKYDFNRKTVSIKAGGSGARIFASASTLLSISSGWKGGGALVLEGDNTTPSNVVLDSSSGTGDVIRISTRAEFSNITIKGFKFISGKDGIRHDGDGTLFVGNNEIGTCGAGSGCGIGTGFAGAKLYIESGVTITVSGNGDKLFDIDSGRGFINGATINFSGATTWTEICVARFIRGSLYLAASFTGTTPTAKKYGVRNGGHIQHDSSAGAILGSLDGTQTSGGTYEDSAAGICLIGLSGVNFPSTQVASTNATTFDDYEEGTWTPVLSFATPGDVSVAYSNQAGTYTKKGREISLHFNITTSTFTHTTASGNLVINGVPFTANATMIFTGALVWRGITKATYTDVSSVISGGTTSVTFQACGSGVTNALVVAADTPTGGTVTLRGGVTYHV